MPNLPYITNIPAAGDNPSDSQPDLQTNNNSLNSLVEVDLYGFNDNNGGYHQKSTYVDQTGSIPGAVAGTDVVYGLTVGSFIELFLQRPTGSAIQLTSQGIIASGFGETFLPGGMQLKWGSKFPTNATGSTFTITFTAAGLTQFPTGCFVAFAIGNQNKRIYVIGTLTATSIVVAADSALGAGDTFYWMAIGN